MASSSTPWQNQIQPENSFDDLAPYSAPKNTEPWDIFIHHYGPDVKYTLATTIHHKLHSMGLHVILDSEILEAGDSFPAELQHVVSSATLHIAIFSPNYAQSIWCLAELSSMLKTGAKIIPIFYHVDPSDLRCVNQGKGKYAYAFSEHEKNGRYKSEKLDEWKRALYNSSFLSGYLVSNNEDEAAVLKNIVNDALKIVKKKGLLMLAEDPFGLDELVQHFESVASDEKVKITGIVGMGGSGKTTLAKELFNRNISSFERCSFISDVRGAATRNALHEKQKKLLVDLGVDLFPFDDVEEGKAVIAYHLSSFRVLVVLDDVDHTDQLNALLPNKDRLGSQSMVIVTTRELSVLKSWGLSCIYRIAGLNCLHAKQLFCWHAFLQPSPPTEFEDLVIKFIMVCSGLPLSLKVFGALLYGKSKDYWVSQLEKVRRILPIDIKQGLKVSYDSLDKEEKETFLDVACFFIGERKSTVIAVWDGSGWSGLHCLERLVNKCLVELMDDPDYNGEKIIRMHDHIRDMGREIASRRSPGRIWFPGQIIKSQQHSTKGQLIRGIQPANAFAEFKKYMHQLMGILNRKSKRLRFLQGLQILSVEGNEFTKEFASACEDLVWLRWEGFPLRFLPSWLKFRGLRVLELHDANELELLWEDGVDPPLQLRELIILGSKKLRRLPSSIGLLRHLKTLQFSFHGSILPEEFCRLRSLERLALSSTVLSSLPTGFGNLTSLRNLNLGYCRQLIRLPDSFSQLLQLEELNLAGCEMLSSLPSGFGNLISLRNLNLGHCRQLSMLSNSFSRLIHLEELNLSGCEMLSSLPDGFDNLMNLRNLNLKDCKHLNMLNLGNLKSLESINLELSTLPGDSKQSLHTSFHELDEEEREMFLDVACFLNGEQINRAIAVWDGSGWSGLRGLEMLVNKYLVELVDERDYKGEKLIRMPNHIRDLGREIAGRHSPYRIWFPGQIIDSPTERKLVRGILPADAFVAFKEYMHQSMGESSTRSQHLMFSTGLQILSVEGKEFTEEFASLSEDLVWLRWEGFPRRNLPPWLPLRNLRVLELSGANEMEELWTDKEHAPLQLRELTITGNWSGSFERFPSSISYLIHLKKISLLGDVGRKFGIKRLPEEFCDLQSLEHLKLRHCTLLSSLPARFGDLRNLRYLDLSSCKVLRTLPVSFQQLTLLNYLDLSGCKRLLLQKDILQNITKLENLYLSGCLALQKIPHHITDQAWLRELQLQYTSLEDLPNNIGQMRKLELLTIGSPLLKSLPDSLGNLSSLKSLSVTNCLYLESLPETFGHLVALEYLSIEVTGMRSLPGGFRRLGNLRILKISDCPLSKLDFGLVSSFSMEKLTEINLNETLVTRISISEDCCPRLELLRLSKNDYLEEIETLPRTVKNIELSECKMLKNIKGILAFSSLQELAISDCPKL